MDNDSAIKKALVKIYRNCRLKIDYFGMDLKSETDGNRLILDGLAEGKPLMVGRFGAVEMRCVTKWINQKEYTPEEREQALFCAGIFPAEDEVLDQFCDIYTKAMAACDILGVWEVVGEKSAIKAYCPQASLIPSRAIEPYYSENPWSVMLRNKKVLIIHPFVETIRQQLEHRELLWPGKDVLPEMKSVSYVKAVQSNAGGKPPFENWIEALEYLKKEVETKDFDIAIIGAGAYGFPLAAHIKGMGKQAVQMSGATQILFGIKGKRWDDHPIISGFYNDAWVRPSKRETPPKTEKVEGGSYW